jgi:phosphatidylserine/phosphatidylglycerophosphate/cardiolipin synthase-like enzyme
VTWDEPLEKAAASLLRGLGPAALQTVVTRAVAGWPRDAILRQTPDATALLDALANVDRTAGLAYLTGLAAGYEQRAAEVTVEIVWSGPASFHVPVRATAAVLADVVGEARRELLLMTYSARHYQPLTDALRAAVTKGVAVTVVVETLQGAGSALAGDEPYQAFTGIGGIDLWRWPPSKRSEPGAKMHAKLAVADRRVLFVSSANLTQSGVTKNIEAGLLVRGGPAPIRAAEHIDALRASGSLVRLT